MQDYRLTNPSELKSDAYSCHLHGVVKPSAFVAARKADSWFVVRPVFGEILEIVQSEMSEKPSGSGVTGMRRSVSRSQVSGVPERWLRGQ
jgi:hypothetical protein